MDLYFQQLESKYPPEKYGDVSDEVMARILLFSIRTMITLKERTFKDMFNALAGLRFNLTKPLRKLVPEVLQRNGRYGADGYDKTDTVYVTRTEVRHDTVYVEQPEQLRRDVFFLINKWDIRPSEQQKVKDVADYLKRYPASKVNLCGYADVQTGNNEINDRLGKNRVNAVKDALVQQYGIPESRIITDSKGSRVQPFPVNEDNRVTICICE